ncbi:hypothetical protein [uncultured Winogradskyella sp.]|uniref:hypothetical protein n=1 Tax=uncultured Winogradskyella sp. TaxID=395353 RepID=UPI0030D73477
MKTKSIVKIGVLVFSFLVLSIAKITQDKEVFIGIYDGKEDYGYTFLGEDEEGDTYTMAFQNIESAALKSFNLDSETFIGSKFSVTYTTKIEVEKDEDGYEDETEINTIVALKKL